jgi:large subunit ribosomal protein L24
MANGTKRAKIKKGDTVIVMVGKDRNIFNRETGARAPHRGKVLEIDPVKGKVKIEGARIVTKHKRANRATGEDGGISTAEGWLDISNVQLLDPDSGRPTRAKYELDADGKKQRVLLKR